jgi:hypothetical protein
MGTLILGVFSIIVVMFIFLVIGNILKGKRARVLTRYKDYKKTSKGEF